MRVRPDLARIDFVARRILPRKIEDAAHIGFFGRRHTEHATEGFDLVGRHRAVGLRHLCAQRYDRDCERDAGVVIVPSATVEKHMSGKRAGQRANRPAAEKETRGGPAHFSPDGHRRNL
jgi:hypothetical protein